jgi:hypothetical protein
MHNASTTPATPTENKLITKNHEKLRAVLLQGLELMCSEKTIAPLYKETIYSREEAHDFQRGFQTHQIAFSAQANTHGALPLSGLHGEQVYFISLRCRSVTAATVLSSKSISIVTNSRADCGHCTAHLAQPIHFSASITM